MEYINCILCNGDDTEKILTGKDLRYGTSDEMFTIVRCKKCKLVYINPRPTKGETYKYYPEKYRTRETIKSENKIKKRMKKYETKRTAFFFKNPWFMKFQPGITVLDIGCGAGELLLRLKELGCNAYGIDIDEITSKYLSGRMNLNVTTCDIDNGTSFPTGFFDVIIMRHSLEHVHNPVNVIHEVRRIMKPRGSLVVGVPNIDSLISKITREKWKDLDIPRHLFHFNPLTISALLHNSGYSIESIHHEFKVSRDSLKDWMATITLPFFFLPKPLRKIMGIIFSKLHKGEWIVVKARKIPLGTETEKFSTYEN
jgi:2-polyprenyl-3-methyl-5-hydroxy-6-metoxy-1,4-benzoquinol methylase